MDGDDDDVEAVRYIVAGKCTRPFFEYESITFEMKSIRDREDNNRGRTLVFSAGRRSVIVEIQTASKQLPIPAWKMSSTSLSQIPIVVYFS